jgi:hypothetical protein
MELVCQALLPLSLLVNRILNEQRLSFDQVYLIVTRARGKAFVRAPRRLDASEQSKSSRHEMFFMF